LLAVGQGLVGDGTNSCCIRIQPVLGKDLLLSEVMDQRGILRFRSSEAPLRNISWASLTFEIAIKADFEYLIQSDLDFPRISS
jgi:hypothetical protein